MAKLDGYSKIINTIIFILYKITFELSGRSAIKIYKKCNREVVGKTRKQSQNL